MGHDAAGLGRLKNSNKHAYFSDRLNPYVKNESNKNLDSVSVFDFSTMKVVYVHTLKSVGYQNKVYSRIYRSSRDNEKYCPNGNRDPYRSRNLCTNRKGGYK